MTPIRVAVIGGDGIGPEVTEQARRVLETLSSAGLVSIGFTEFPHGADHYLETGETLSDESFARLRDDFEPSSSVRSAIRACRTVGTRGISCWASASGSTSF